MSEGERRITDVRGRFLQAVRNGSPVDDASWTRGRILLSNKRLVLAAGDGKRTVPLSAVEEVGGRYDVNQATAKRRYVSIRCDGDVVLLSTNDVDALEYDLYAALLNRSVVLVRHPAVRGGVVTDEEWQKARIKLDDGAVTVATAQGGFVEIDLDDIGSVDVAERTVVEETRSVIEVEHTEDGTSVQTYFSGDDRRSSFLESLLEGGEERNTAELDLDERETRVLMALYSGVSPFEIPDFTGMEVDRVEEIFAELVELDVLDEVRKRREVTLTARGRNVASEAINEE